MFSVTPQLATVIDVTFFAGCLTTLFVSFLLIVVFRPQWFWRMVARIYLQRKVYPGNKVTPDNPLY